MVHLMLHLFERLTCVMEFTVAGSEVRLGAWQEG